MSNQQWQPPPQNGQWGQQLPPAPQAQPQQQGGYPPPPPPAGYPAPAPAQGYQPVPQGYPQPQQQGGYQPPAPVGYQQSYGADPLAGLNLTTGDQTGGERLPFLEGEGDFLLEILQIFNKETRGNNQRGTKPGNFVVIYEKILETNDPEGHPVGASFSTWIDLGNVNMRGINISRFLSALHGFDPTQLPKDSPVAPWQDRETGQYLPWGQLLARACSSAQPFKGARIGVKTRLTDKDFLVPYWAPAEGFQIGPRVVRAQKNEPMPTAAGAWPPPQWQGGTAPGFPTTPGAPPGYGAPPQQQPMAPGFMPAPGYGAPQGVPPGYGVPPQQPMPQQAPQGAPPGYGAPQGYPVQQPMPPGYPTGPWGQPQGGGGQQR